MTRKILMCIAEMNLKAVEPVLSKSSSSLDALGSAIYFANLLQHLYVSEKAID